MSPRAVTPIDVSQPRSSGIDAARRSGHVLSLFPGIDLIGRGFEMEGFSVVRGPDPLWGGCIRRFHPPPGVYDGIIAGSPCQDFSSARRAAPTGDGLELLRHFLRCVAEARPNWFLLENVPRVPNVTLQGYSIQRFDLRAQEVGLRQRRLRHFQFGSRTGQILILDRDSTALGFHQVDHNLAPTAMASEANRPHRRTWADFCELQGLPRDFDLTPLRVSWRYSAVGNGVPVPMARLLARAVILRRDAGTFPICLCGCGRPLAGKQKSAGAACRKRLERKRRDSAGGAHPRAVTI